MPTATHVPIPHFRVVDMLKHTLAFYGHEVTAEHYGERMLEMMKDNSVFRERPRQPFQGALELGSKGVK